MKTNRKHGFTIVELVVVIAIIAVLAAVLIPTFTSIVKKANDSAYLQERTNQQIADLAEKVENLNYFTWEDFEKKLAEELAKVGSTDTEAIQKAVDAAIAKYSDSSQTGNTGLTETQVKKIVEEAMKGQLTTAQVEAIVRQVLSGTTVSEETIRTIVNNAVKGMSTTGVTKAQVEQAIKAAISGTIAVNDEQLEAAVTKALEAFGVSTITDQQVEEIVSNLKNVIMINDEPGFSAATDTGSYAINPDDANKVYYLVTEVALDSFTITGSTDATTIIIDAPNIKDVTIEGNAKVLRVLRTADESTHIKGTVTTLEVNSGRVVIEADATVGTIKAAPAKQATVTIVLENGSKVTNLNSEFQYYAGTNDYIKIIDNGATVGNSFITSSSAVTTSTTTNVVLTGPAFVDTTTDTLKVENKSGVDAQIKVIDAEDHETTYTTNGQSSNLTLFAGGTGTEADPYLIYDYATMQNISKLYDSGYNYFAVDISKTDNGKIDCKDWISIYLNGSFDGKGVKFVNVDKQLFRKIGKFTTEATNYALIQNMDVTFDVHAPQGASLIHNLHVKDTDFRNVNIHGYLEGGANSAAYYNYGCMNGGSATKMTVNFYDCDVDATLVSVSGNLGIYSGMCYGGTGDLKTTINVDSESEWAGEAYLMSGKQLLKLCGTNANAYLQNTGDNTAITENVYTNLVKKEPSKNGDSKKYTVEKQSGASYVVVYINGQFTENDSNGNQIPNKNGITCTIGSFTLSWDEIENGVIFDKIDNVIFNASQNGYDYSFASNVLTFSAGGRDQNTTGKISIRVCQYSENNRMVAASGELTVAEKTVYNGNWDVK